MNYESLDEQRLTGLKRLSEGQELIKFVEMRIEELQRKLDLNTPPDMPGVVGLTIGMIRAYRELNELLQADYVPQGEE